MEGAVALQLVDERWKLSGSKKGFGSRSVSCSRRGGDCSSSWKSQLLSRSSSSCSAATTTTAAPPSLKRQGSVGRLVRGGGGGGVKCSSSSRSSSSSSSFTRRCAKLVKEQRARFYIVRRCVTMLVCWKDYADDV